MATGKEQLKFDRSPQDLERIRAIREVAHREKPTLDDLLATGDYTEPLPLGDYIELVQAVALLRRAREQAGLSVADIADRTGLDGSVINEFESGMRGDPTVATLQRYAAAIGKHVTVKITDLPQMDTARAH